MSSDLTIGFWDDKQDQFGVFATIRDPQGKHSALAIYAPQSEQEVHNCLRVLQAKGLLKFEDGHYVVMPRGEQYHNQLQALLHAPQLESEQHDQKA